MVDVYPCTEKDYAKFYEPAKQTKGLFEEHRENKDLYYLDWEQTKLGLRGDYSSGTYGKIDIIAVPCHMGQAFGLMKSTQSRPTTVNGTKLNQ